MSDEQVMADIEQLLRTENLSHADVEEGYSKARLLADRDFAQWFLGLLAQRDIDLHGHQGAERAERVLQEIRSFSDRSGVLIRLSEFWQSSESSDEAFRMLGTLMTLTTAPVDQDSNYWQRVDAALAASRIYAALGASDHSRSSAEVAERMAYLSHENLEIDNPRIMSLAAVRLAELGDFDRAFKLASGIGAPGIRDSAMQKLRTIKQNRPPQ